MRTKEQIEAELTQLNKRKKELEIELKDNIDYSDIFPILTEKIENDIRKVVKEIKHLENIKYQFFTKWE